MYERANVAAVNSGTFARKPGKFTRLSSGIAIVVATIWCASVRAVVSISLFLYARIPASDDAPSTRADVNCTSVAI